MTFKSGFVAILGRPNVGKSTFLNHVMGQKIAIMSDKAQTTRNKIMGIYTTDQEQIVFIDTPGIHKPKTALGDFMVESAYSTLREVDTVLFMVSADEKRSGWSVIWSAGKYWKPSSNFSLKISTRCETLLP